MYYQVYNTKTGKVLITCPDVKSAAKMMQAMENPDLSVRPIELTIQAFRSLIRRRGE
jgi:crotonobetainyl-CoA:carnitine CoA-transferase CaiB-like acyl-CoA transferase